MNIQQWLNTLVPMAQIAQVVNQVLPAFVIVAAMILVIGYYIGIVSSPSVFPPLTKLILLFVCIAGSPWMLGIAQQIANALVGVVASAIPNMGWLVVNNPNDATLSMDFSKPFGIISQYIAGKTGPAPPGPFAEGELNKWAAQSTRALFIFVTAGVACITVFIMQAMLIIQKLILVFSKLLVPIFTACLSLPSAEGSGQNFLKSIAGVMCWPVGWAIVHIATMAGLQALQPPSLNAQLGELLLSFGALAVVCLWMVVGTIGAPKLIANAVTSGTNFATGMVGGFASAAGQHAARGLKAGGAVAGALVGGAHAGPAGAPAGASWGSKAGGALALPSPLLLRAQKALTRGADQFLHRDRRQWPTRRLD